ncbi:hypothetical protein ASE48_22500 [Mycobacterium sp. Root265]|uniref:hypothetical protein n=1 Tax=Mycobacterium sp. Root265 TaxID=1736504 RepID=UPI00070AB7D4|nr:hypothetical protein [Mycobacterium sp. Root265]KRD19797.1 hypothetical protein ASE48_22500 [Mycobacterium sp. Root265]
MSAQPGKPQPAQPDAALLGYGDAVTPLAWNDPHVSQVGTVRRTVLRGGDIEVTVQFADGTRRDYWEDELRRI